MRRINLTPAEGECYKAAQFKPYSDGDLRVEYAELSLVGGREDNQDRCAVAVSEHAALLFVVDGMGGHAEGALAAETATRVLVEAFWHTPHPLFDPIGFLHLGLGRAHEAVVKLGSALPLEQRPRATCAVCIVQGDSAYFAHIGDSRIYLIRAGKVAERTRDHSHVEFLLREGLIAASQAHAHPLRNFVECCIGGEQLLPEMTLTGRRQLHADDVLLVCSDGLWGGLDDETLAAAWIGDRANPPAAGAATGGSMRATLLQLAQRAIIANGNGSDNTTAVALRWQGP